MFNFLKNIMKNTESTLQNYVNLVHRVLKTDIKKDPNSHEDEIIFGCGCFWGAENVLKLQSSYNFRRLCRRRRSNPTYYEVCSGLTGHTEVVELFGIKVK